MDIQPRQFKIIHPLETTYDFGLIISGVARHYYIDKKNKDWTKNFAGSGDLIGPYAEYIQNKPSRTYCQALTPMTILKGSKKELDMTKIDVWHSFWRALAERFYVFKENREYEFLMYDAKQRYD